MLEALCGSKSVQRILIFLFVNGKCYGTELCRLLNASLTPIQKALKKLEVSGIITSDYAGKTRVYQFNPAYPLLKELEQLLKKAYTLLPANEKKQYYATKEEGIQSDKKNPSQVLLAFWEKLQTVKHLAFYAKGKSKHEGGWSNKGQGEVLPMKNDNQTITFHEKGVWQGKKGQGEDVNFSNVFRWTLDREKKVISLEHLRLGPLHPVFLFYLVPSGRHTLTSEDSHLCGGDTYFGQIHFDTFSFRLNLRVIGPKKNDELDYYYS